jgi:Uma2 family endonuclease
MVPMPTLTPPPVPAGRAAPGPRALLWTVEQFHYLGDLGMFEGRRAMLIDGVIIEDAPMNPPHAIAATKTEDAVREAFGKRYHVRVSKPLVLGQTTDPEPDVAVVVGRPGDYTEHPTTAALVVEVSDSSLRYDTTVKVGLYAAGGVPEYWVLDVTARQLLVYRDPKPDPGATHGHTYATQLALSAADAVAPGAVPNVTLPVADLLP